jgi:hypothetical protein
MTRWLLLALAITACAKGKDSAPAATTSADTSAPTPTPTKAEAPAAIGDGDPRQQALDQARNQASLGVSAHTDSFEPIEGGTETGSATQKKPTTERRREGGAKVATSPGGGGAAAPTVGLSGGTRGDADKLAYRAQIVAVTLDGKPAPAALLTAVKARATKVQACYETSLRAWPELVGKLAVTFTLLPVGALSDGAVASSTVKQSGLETCVIAALQATRLSAPLGTTKASAEVTIVFKLK